MTPTIDEGDRVAKLMMTRQHPEIKAKQPIWRLIRESYQGGIAYNPSNLIEHPSESPKGYAARQKRAVFTNHLGPLAQIMSGFVYSQPPSRAGLEGSLAGFVANTSKGKALDEFMRGVCLNSALHVVAVVVDMPRRPDDVEVVSKADEIALGLTPFACQYLPWQICDLYVGEDGALEWILLDNSGRVAADPTKEEEQLITRRLWKKDTWQDFRVEQRVDKDGNSKPYYTSDPPETHGLGFVPVRMVAWQDLNDDQIADSPFEDIALQDRDYYNTDSEMREALAGGAFGLLTFQGSESEFPQSVQQSGLSSLSVLCYPPDREAPAFASKDGGDVTRFLLVLELIEKRILSKLGMDPDHDKKFVQSGVAKSLEFQKCQVILNGGIAAMQELELWMFRTALAWMDKASEADAVTVEYFRDPAGDDVEMRLNRLYRMLVLSPKEQFQQAVQELIATLTLLGAPAGAVEKILAGLQAPSAPQPTPPELAEAEAKSRAA